MKRFLLRLILFTLPLWLFLGVYVIEDPFRVLHSYDDLLNLDDSLWVNVNRDFVSTQAYELQSSNEINSFILGNSRSLFFQVEDWKEHLPSDSRMFHFDASSETLYGITSKLEYLLRKDAEIDHALIVLDRSVLTKADPRTGHLFSPSPQLAPLKHSVNFHYSHVRSFASIKFMKAYLGYKWFDIIPEPKRLKMFFKDKQRTYIESSNEIRQDTLEALILNGEFYTPKKMTVFYDRSANEQVSDPVIHERQYQKLNRMQEILKESKTSYQIVISPLYDQKKLPKEDLDVLHALFGSESVHDFSGINEFTSDYRNYYEDSHYRPHVAKEIMKRIYQ